MKASVYISDCLAQSCLHAVKVSAACNPDTFSYQFSQATYPLVPVQKLSGVSLGHIERALLTKGNTYIAKTGCSQLIV